MLTWALVLYLKHRNNLADDPGCILALSFLFDAIIILGIVYIVMVMR